MPCRSVDITPSTRSSNERAERRALGRAVRRRRVEFLRGQTGRHAVPVLRRVQRASRPARGPAGIITAATMPTRRRCRRTSRRSILSTTASWTSATSGWHPGRGPPRSSASIWPTITPRSRSSMPRSAASSTRSRRADRRRTRSSSSPATTAWPSAATACSASRISTITRCGRRWSSPGRAIPQGPADRRACAICSTSSRPWATWPACCRPRGQRGAEPRPRSSGGATAIGARQSIFTAYADGSAGRPRRPLEADRLSRDQQDPALRPQERPGRDPRPRRRPRASGRGRTDARPARELAADARRSPRSPRRISGNPDEESRDLR